ncbi:MAG: Ig-like domain-containing protein [Ruminococcaceae bacterium]|nr:Ig-like domain-containing protein [Oscillospiraceae bacterium]
MKRTMALFLSLLLVFGMCMPVLAAEAGKDDELRLSIIVPENWEMEKGDSRTLDVLISGTEKRVLVWSAEPSDVASVDIWGRVTALKAGTATITAQNADGLTDSVELTVVKKSTKIADSGIKKVDFNGEAVAEGSNLQKIVSRFSKDSKDVPAEVADESKYANAKTATTADGAKWEIMAYGVLRTDENAKNARDREQRFMGDRYFYANDTSEGNVLAIFADGKNGIWTVMADGYTHIEMLDIDGTDKAAMMSEETQKYVARRGMVSNAYLIDGEWIPEESDNDGLWTSMYGGGELMRYAVLKNDPTATKAEIEAARKTATSSVEAVLLLTYISMREGTVEAYNRAQRNGNVNNLDKGKYYTDGATIVGGDYSQDIPYESPADAFDNMYNKYMKLGIRSYVQDYEDHLKLYSPESWTDPNAEGSTDTYVMRTRLLEGFWARTYSFKSEKEAGYSDYDGYAYWSHNGDGTATGMSTKTNGDGSDYLLHNENYRGLKVNATGEIPERLWNNLIGKDYDIEDIVYKGDTSSDEIIGHLFLYKLAYDILAPEDPELKAMLEETMEKFAQHLVDNSYTMVDGSGQPTTWAKFSRIYFHNGQTLGGSPLNSLVILTAFKVAAYITGNQKWEDEYRMAALAEGYEYAEIMTQELERYEMCILEFANSVSPVLGFILRPIVGTEMFKTLYRIILNYSDEEMAMLGFYTLFQLEDDEELLEYYREALDGWWYSMSFSENALWYYVYQLAYPDEVKTDYYGNSLIETASWVLDRHPIDLRRMCATNPNRDDVYELDLDDFGIEGTSELSFDANGYLPPFWNSDNNTLRLIGAVLGLGKLDWKVAAPDERSLHKYNGSTYEIDNAHNPGEMEGSTTYSLPYWMGRYHNMLTK